MVWSGVDCTPEPKKQASAGAAGFDAELWHPFGTRDDRSAVERSGTPCKLQTVAVYGSICETSGGILTRRSCESIVERAAPKGA